MRYAINRCCPFLALAVSLTGFSSVALGQYVIDSAFCFEIDHNQCGRVIPSGSNVSISALSKTDTNSTVYFWAILKNPDAAAIAVYMQRNGDCYHEQFTVAKESATSNPTLLDEALAYFKAFRGPDLWTAIGLSDLEAKLSDVKIFATFLPKADSFRTYDYRYVHCGGTVRARILGSDGKPIPGKNEWKYISIK